MKGIITTLLSLSLMVNVFGQDKDSLVFVNNKVSSYGLGGIINNSTILSSLNYSGPSFDYSCHKFRDYKGGIINSYFMTAFGYFTNSESKSYELGFHTNYNYGYNHHIASFDNKRLNLYAGASLGADLNFIYFPLYTNNPVSVIADLNLYPSFLIKYKFKLAGLNFEASNETNFSLIGMSFITPDYAFSVPYEYYENEDITDAFHFMNITNNFVIINRTYLDFKVWRKNNLRFTYMFDGRYTKVNDNEIRYYSHCFMIGFVYKIFK